MCLKNDINSHNDNRFEKKHRFWVKSDFGLFFEKPKKRFDKNYKKQRNDLAKRKLGC